MSYILDALKKSEQQRLQGAAPGLLTVHMPPEDDTPSAYLVYGVIAAALIGAGVAIGWWRPWQHAQAFSAPQPLAPKTLESRPAPALPEPPPGLSEAGREPGQETPVQESSAHVEPPVAPQTATSARRDTDLRTRAAAETQKLVSKTVAALPKVTAAAAPDAAIAPAAEKAPAAPAEGKAGGVVPAEGTPPAKVIPMAELPPAILKELPAMSIPVHTYSSTPEERIVGINDRLLQEGDYVAPGLKLEQIAPDGLVFSYKKYFFRRGFQ